MDSQTNIVVEALLLCPLIFCRQIKVEHNGAQAGCFFITSMYSLYMFMVNQSIFLIEEVSYVDFEGQYNLLNSRSQT